MGFFCFNQPVTGTEHTTVTQRSYSNRRHLIWKFNLRVTICTMNVVAIGCASWIIIAMASINSNPYVKYFESYDSNTIALVVLCTSFVWCSSYIAIPYLFKPRRAIHPGLAVGFDLVFCGAFITAGIFGLTSLISVINFGSDPSYLSDPGYNRRYSGNYYLAPNHTWIYNITYAYGDTPPYYNYTSGIYVYDTGDIRNVTRYCSPQFSNCVQQDAEVNRVWQSKPILEGTEVVMNAVMWLDVLLHLVLFVWACVDTHVLNTRGKKTREQIIEARIMADLSARGLLLTDMSHSDTSKVPPPAYTKEV